MMCLISWTTTPPARTPASMAGDAITRRTFGQTLGLAAARARCRCSRTPPRTRRRAPRGRAERRRCAVRPDGDRAGGAHPAQGGVRPRRDGGASRADRAGQPEGQRDRHAGGGTRAGRRGARRRADRAWRPARRAAWAAGRAQGSRRHGRHPHDARIAVLSRSRADGRRADRHAPARRWRDHLRQDQHAGARRRIADVQRGLRRDAQSVRRHEDLRRQQRRRGGRARLRHGADRRRQRHRRIAAQSRRLLQRRRLPAVAGPRAERRVVVAALGVGTDGAHRRGRRAVPERDCRSGPAQRRSRSPRIRRKFRAPLDRDFKGVRVAWWNGLGGIPVEPDIVRVDQRQPHGLRDARLRRRRRRARLRRRRSGVSRAALHRPITRSTPRSSGSSRTG